MLPDLSSVIILSFQPDREKLLKVFSLDDIPNAEKLYHGNKKRRVQQ
jgi:hypothetical protein